MAATAGMSANAMEVLRTGFWTGQSLIPTRPLIVIRPPPSCLLFSRDIFGKLSVHTFPLFTDKHVEGQTGAIMRLASNMHL